MTTPTFPNIGIFITDSQNYSRVRRPTVVRTNMESGPPKELTVASQSWIDHQVTYIFTKAEYATFDSFFCSDLMNGSQWFTWTDPFDNNTKLARITGGAITSVVPVNPTVTHLTVKFPLETVN